MRAFPLTLQRYIFREMGKTFLLASVGLTGVLGLGGGVLNMIELGEVTPGQFAHLMLILLPLSAALTMPLAALFGAASTYGRLSADNEFVACRSSGINIHVLFLPAIVLSVVVACVTFVFFNFVVPGMVMSLDTLVRSDLQSMIEQRLHRSRGISFGDYRIFADNTMVGDSDPDTIELQRVAFVEMKDESWERIGTARKVLLRFDRSGPKVAASGELIGLTCLDPDTLATIEFGQQSVARNVLPEQFLLKLKFLKLGELLHYWRNPTAWQDVREGLDKLRFAAGRLIVYDGIYDEFLRRGEVAITDTNVGYTIRADTCGQSPREGIIEFGNVVIEETKSGRTRTVTAKRAIIEVPRADRIGEASIVIEVYDARLSDGDATIEKPKEQLTPVCVSPDLIERVNGIALGVLLDAGSPDGSPDRLAEERLQLGAVIDTTVRKIRAVVNERTAFSVSACVLVLLGAVMGIVFRGSHVLTAFGISFVPMLVVIVTIVMGKQLTQNPGTTWSGLVLIWSGIVIVGSLDVWTLTRVLRR